MRQSVNVNSIASVRDFRASLATFGEAATQILDNAEMEVRRVVQWVQHDQMAYWKNEVRRSWELVAEARRELEQCRSRATEGQRPSCFQERKALEAAKRYVQHAQEKVEIVRKWSGRLQKEVSEYEGRISQTRSILSGDLPRWLSLLERMMTSLESYVALDSGQRASSPAAASAARTSSPGRRVEKSPYQKLRERTPPAETRAATKPPEVNRDDVEEQDQPDAEQLRQHAIQAATLLGAPADCPDLNDKVVLAAGALAGGDIYLERIASEEAGDTGWFLGSAEKPQETIDNGGCEAIALADLVDQHPALVQAMALPPGYLAVFSEGQLAAVLDPRGADLWGGEGVAQSAEAENEESAEVEHEEPDRSQQATP